MRKMILGALATLLLLGGAFGASAAKPDHAGGPGPNGNNDKGLCTAYFNGQKNGHDKHGSPGPFAALERAAADDDDETSVTEEVFNYCDGMIGGNPDHGRYSCTAGKSDDPTTPEDESTSTECTQNEGPGNS